MRTQPSIRPALLLGGFLLLGGCDSGAPGADDRNESAAAATIGPTAEPTAAPLMKAPADLVLDEAELIRLERDYAQALIRKDRDFLMRFYAPDWRGGNWMGFWSKSTLLKSVLNERYVVKSMNLRDLKVRLMGDTAIVQGVDEEVTSVDGKDTSGKWAFTDVFERRSGRWAAVASHTSEVRPMGR